jgi:Predicted membrane protein (DUF2142)
VSERTRPSFAAWKIYLLVVVPATILLNLTFPNFHAPDDYDHVKRAYTLVHGPLRTITPEGRSSGALVDSGLAEYIDAQIPLVKSSSVLTSKQRLLLQAGHHIRWSGKQTFTEMPGALSYFPLLYAPQTAALELGRIVGASVEVSVFWARLANGLAGIVLAAIGLYLLRGGQAIVLFLLLLPRTLLQFASNSADPILYGLALIIVALGVRAAGSDRLRSGLIAAALFISGAVRPPIAALALTPAVQAVRERRWLNLAVLGGGCAGAAIWVLTVLSSIADLRCGNLGEAAPKLQTFALRWPQLVGQSFGDHAVYYYVSFIGHYGWGDGRTGIIGTPMPSWVYLTALPLFAAAACRDLLAPVRLPAILRISLLLSAFFSVLLTFLAMYVGCTASGQSVIGGVQGRYFVTALFAVGLAIGGLLSGHRSLNLDRPYLTLITVWSLACTATMLINSAQLYGSLR